MFNVVRRFVLKAILWRKLWLDLKCWWFKSLLPIMVKIMDGVEFWSFCIKQNMFEKNKTNSELLKLFSQFLPIKFSSHNPVIFQCHHKVWDIFHPKDHKLCFHYCMDLDNFVEFRLFICVSTLNREQHKREIWPVMVSD